ncbi:hypothetical protein TVAG_269050 [Trichomonas vaginalis G3]|uniref:Uncharacterized protein n=1 Tax=Trichomonas vaginalis (strain ATCC PRA-98 / G3) TaxID=412133 RepID=A2EG18_TRIV3|nr:armadillo (ARM) repeat-containing protein family [Trichomonas vaginalis G3]EAY08379.1 hypothetical protein TVAG_269050 [Trichomonas vaginalis G3]KAI5499341.1 armadillo (ARM) repeat-containing protein family [Trichomonas vaginalis G3]|eukprot:XP_001320602.1 hypothetical protein [Trichomonas vaginalis G3]
MSDLISALQPIASAKKLFPAESPICEALFDFEEKIKAGIPENELTTILSLLLNVLRINDGKISMFCSVRIAQCIQKVYEAKNTKDISEIIVSATKHPIQSLVYAVGYLLKYSGNTNEDKILPFATKLLSVDSEINHAIMYTLARCYEFASESLKKLQDKVFYKIVFNLSNTDDTVQLMTLKLCRRLIRCNAIDIPKLYSVLTNFLKYKNRLQHFVIDDCCFLLATCAVRNLDKPDENKAELKEALGVLKLFHDFFTQCLRHFLDLLPPQYISNNFEELFDFVREVSLSDLVQIIPYIGIEMREKLFKKVAAEEISYSQLMTLRLLANTAALAKETASIALQMATNLNDDVRSGLQSFFAYLAQLYPDLALQYLESSLLYLSNPPDEPGNGLAIEGMVVIAASVIGGTSEPEKVLKPYTSNIEKFLKDTFGHLVLYSHKTVAAFRLLTITPRESLPVSDVNAALKQITDDINDGKVDITSHSVKEIIRAANCALYTHPDLSAAKEYLLAASKLTLINSSTANLAMFLALPLVKPPEHERIAMMLVRKIVNLEPPMYFLCQQVKQTIQMQEEMLFHAVIVTYNSGPLFNNINSATFAVRVVNSIADFVKALPIQSAINFVTEIFRTSGKMSMVHALIYKLVEADLLNVLPQNTMEYLLAPLDKDNDDYDRMRITAEALALYTQKTNTLQKVLEMIDDWHCPGKCILLGALVQYCSFSEEQLFKSMHDLCELTKSSNSSPFALFALSLLYDTNVTSLVGNPLIVGQLTSLMRVMSSYTSLSSYTFYYLSMAFGKLIPILSVEYSKYEKEIKIFTMLLSQQILPISHQASYQIWRLVAAYLPQLSNLLEVKYPDRSNITMSQEISACNALNEYITMVDPNLDVFDSVSRILFLVQKKDDPRPVDLFGAMINSKCDHSEELYKIARDLLLESKFPGMESGQVEPLSHTKACCVNIITKLLPKLDKKHSEEIVKIAVKVVSSELPNTAGFAFKLLYEMLRMNMIEVNEEYSENLGIAIKKCPVSDLSNSLDFLSEVIFQIRNEKVTKPYIETICHSFISLFDRVEINEKSVMMATNLLSLSQRIESENLKNEILEKFKESVKKFVEDFVTKFKSNDWDYISSMRKMWIHDLNDFYNATKIEELEIDQEMIRSFADEESKSKDAWRSTSAKDFLA